MAEEDKNKYDSDEYHFSDLDAISPETEETSTDAAAAESRAASANIKRNAIIVIVIVVLLMLGYALLGPLFTKKTTLETVPPIGTGPAQPTSIPQAITPTPTPTTTPQPIEPPVQPVSSPSTDQITQRLSSLEQGQQNLRSEMDTLNGQLTTLNTNISAVGAKISELNQNLTAIAARVEEQSKEIALCAVKLRPPAVHRVLIKRPLPPVFFIQAIIPGRAWLIAQNGSTITVREGTPIAGYGIVKLIDSRQGKILTTSGRIIRFSQQDS